MIDGTKKKKAKLVILNNIKGQLLSFKCAVTEISFSDIEEKISVEINPPAWEPDDESASLSKNNNNSQLPCPHFLPNTRQLARN